MRSDSLDTLGVLDGKRFIVDLREDRNFIDCVGRKENTRIVEDRSRGVRTKDREGANFLEGAGEARLL